MNTSRRQFLQVAAAGLASSYVANSKNRAQASQQEDDVVRIVHPRDRVPLSFIIDDSTCLVNMAHYCMPQFATAWPERDTYKKPWKEWPREIPDSFVREFGEWCSENGVKGKYSIVPYPACVGWLDRELPGWSRRELVASIDLVRDLMLPNWDIHPEMITHTRVIDLKTGRPLEAINAGTMENSFPQEKKSVDELTEYLAYALNILKRCGLPCEGITTPGGFGNLVKTELGLAAFQAVRDVYGTEIPHYFKYVKSGDESTEPVLEHVSRDGTTTDLVVNIPAGTGDWFGGWDGVRTCEGDRYADEDASSGRMVELIERGDPAVMLCHWPGLYNNGTKEGLHQFQTIVRALHARFADQTQWMKLTEMARYWATKGTVTMEYEDRLINFDSAFDCPQFTIRVKARAERQPAYFEGEKVVALVQVNESRKLEANTWFVDEDELVICFNLARGESALRI